MEQNNPAMYQMWQDERHMGTDKWNLFTPYERGTDGIYNDLSKVDAVELYINNSEFRESFDALIARESEIANSEEFHSFNDLYNNLFFATNNLAANTLLFSLFGSAGLVGAFYARKNEKRHD